MHSLIVGGSRGGKTFLFLRQMVIRAIRASGSRHGAFRHKFNAARTSLWLDTLPSVMSRCFPSVEYEPHEADGYLEFWNGSELWIGGLDDKVRVDKVLGREFATLFFNEVSQIPHSSILVARTRLAQKCYDDKTGEPLPLRAYYDLNPCGKGHWTYQEFFEHKEFISKKPLPDPENYEAMGMSPEDNAENLPPQYIAMLKALPEKQRARFYAGRYVDEVEGALWSIEGLEALRVTEDELPPMKRVVVSVDPSGASGPEDVRSDEIGITVAGLGEDGHGYLLADYSGRYSPEEWASRALRAYQAHEADAIVAEKNFGGDMVRATIESQAREKKLKGVKVIPVTASRGKTVRAEPVSALHDAGLIHHVGHFPELEEQLLAFSRSGYTGARSPDRADSAIWGFTDLMVTSPDIANQGILEFAMRQNAERRAAKADEQDSVQSIATPAKPKRGSSNYWKAMGIGG